jgi:hypothetical protein
LIRGHHDAVYFNSMALLHFRLFKASRRYITDQRCADLEGTATFN